MKNVLLTSWVKVALLKDEHQRFHRILLFCYKSFGTKTRYYGSQYRQNFLKALSIDGLVKSRKTPLSVIPAKAGIQSIQIVKKALDSGFHRSDDFLRDYQY